MQLLLGNMNYSSWSIRAALVAQMSDLDIPETILPLAMPETRAVLLDKTGFKQVPVLLVGDLVIRDSLAITEWIAEQSGPGTVWPKASSDRARARMAVAEMHSGFSALRRNCPVDIRNLVEFTPNEETAADIARVLDIRAECRANASAKGPYLFGAWSAVDAFYAPVVTRFRTYGIALTGADADYAAAVLAHPDTAAIEAKAIAEPWKMVQGPTGMVAVMD